MNIDVEHVKGAVDVAVLSTHGDLDASNYLELIAKGQALYQGGTRYLLLDMSDTPFMSSSGLVALHSLALLMRGEKPADAEAGWGSLHAFDQESDSGLQPYVKLLNPQPRVTRTLERTGLDTFFAVFTDREAALASYQ
jgi:anti-anti-sigma regulatory factor